MNRDNGGVTAFCAFVCFFKKAKHFLLSGSRCSRFEFLNSKFEGCLARNACFGSLLQIWSTQSPKQIACQSADPWAVMTAGLTVRDSLGNEHPFMLVDLAQNMCFGSSSFNFGGGLALPFCLGSQQGQNQTPHATSIYCHQQ